MCPWSTGGYRGRESPCVVIVSSINLDPRIEIRVIVKKKSQWSGPEIGDVVYPRGKNIPENAAAGAI